MSTARPFTRTRTEVIDCDCAMHRDHGTLHTYRQHLCGCVPCLHAHRATDAAARKHGPATVPAIRVRTHIEALIADGATLSEIGRQTGYGRSTIHYIYRYSQRVDRYVAADILSVPTAVAA